MADSTRLFSEEKSLASARRRLLANVELVDPPAGIKGQCRLWRGSCNDKGYGQLRVHRKTRRAARVAYELFKGPIPKRYVLDHLCRRRRCINEDHLEPVTNRVNLLRGNTFASRHAMKTHCANGHAFSVENTYLYSWPKWKGPRCPVRMCRQCVKNRASAKRRKLREERLIYA